MTLKKILDLPEMWSVKDVQEYLNLSKSSTYRLFNDKDFPSILIGGTFRVRKDDFLKWLEQQKK